MVTPGRKKGTVRFAVTPGDGARKVAVAADFTSWKPVPMKKQKDGTFVTILPVSSTSCEYKFIIDDQWVADPDNENRVMNPYGTLNSFAQL